MKEARLVTRRETAPALESRAVLTTSVPAMKMCTMEPGSESALEKDTDPHGPFSDSDGK